MTDRDRLVKLIAEADTKCANTIQCEGCKQFCKGGNCVDYNIADYLLANGVIVPPCKVGDTVYSINKKALASHWDGHRYVVDKWSEYKVCEIPFSLTLWECGWKNIFLTKEEAERALKESEDNG